MKTEISFWSCIILSAIWLNGDKQLGEIWAIFWFVVAIFFLIVGDKNEKI